MDYKGEGVAFVRTITPNRFTLYNRPDTTALVDWA